MAINSSFLSPRIGCGQMLTRIPAYQGNEIFRDVMRAYSFPKLHADKPAAKILEDEEHLMRQFCINAEDGKLPLKLNFRGVYAVRDIFLLTDQARQSAYFVAAPDNRLALTNYYRDAMFKLPEMLGLTLAGSTNRLTPIGWQNLHDIMNDVNFRSSYPGVERIEVMASLPAARWRQPVLEVGVNLLNFSNAKAVRQAMTSEVLGGAEADSDRPLI
jgi:hypothetical protein